MASTYLRKAFSTTGNRQKFSLSMWIKRGSGLGVEQMVCECYSGSSAKDEIWLQSNDSLNFVKTDGGGLATTTAPVYRDVAAWYHFLIAADTTQGSNADRVKIYKNGVQQTLSQQDTIVQDSNFQFGASGAELTFGVKNDLSWYFDGSMANVEMVDGQQLDPTYFGSTDTATGIWTPEASSTISDYGTNGFKLKMDTTSPGADTSGKGNTFTPSGTPTLTQGSPSNVWATWNPLAKYNRSATFANGNTTVNSDNNSLWDSARGTFGFEKGKWYWETKFFGSSAAFNYIGVCNENAIMGTNDAYDKNAVTVFYNADGGEMRKDGNPTSANYGTFSTSEVCGVAVDADNNTISIYKNNSIIVTNYALSTSSIGNNGTGFIFPNAAVLDNGSGQYTNFGEGFFGTVAAGTSADGNGQGLFAYAPPSGYYAMNTKNLEAYG